MDIIKRAFISQNQKNCPVFGVMSKDLKDYTTTEKDMNKKLSRFPPNEQRLPSEDLLTDVGLITDGVSKMSTAESTENDFEGATNTRQE